MNNSWGGGSDQQQQEKKDAPLCTVEIARVLVVNLTKLWPITSSISVEMIKRNTSQADMDSEEMKENVFAILQLINPS